MGWGGPGWLLIRDYVLHVSATSYSIRHLIVWGGNWGLLSPHLVQHATPVTHLPFVRVLCFRHNRQEGAARVP